MCISKKYLELNEFGNYLCKFCNYCKVKHKRQFGQLLYSTCLCFIEIKSNLPIEFCSKPFSFHY